MPKDLYSRYIWLIDTIRRYGSISRRELNDCWVNSRFSNGTPLPRRTFFNYRQAIEDIFKLTIEFNPSTNTYSIPDSDDHNVTDWMLNSASLTDILTDSRDISDRVFLEDVPSARIHLPSAIAAIKQHHPLIFDYQPYSRTLPTPDISLDPYFLKIFRQRWYLTGLNHADNAIKTYALDRMSNVRLSTRTFAMPEDFDPEAYFRYSFGIIFNQGDVKDIVIKTDSRQAKYFRALPLHHTQTEEVSDSYSVFTYRMKISDDLVSELLSYGPRITVLRPPELRAMIIHQLKAALDGYGSAARPDENSAD